MNAIFKELNYTSVSEKLFMEFLKKTWNDILSTGITKNTSFLESRKTKILNGIAIIIILIAVIRFFDAVYWTNYGRMYFNLSLFTVGIAIFILHYLGQQHFIRHATVVGVSFIISFFSMQFGFLHYPNYLLAILVFTFLVFENKKILLAYSFLTCLMYLSIYFWFFSQPSLLTEAAKIFNPVPIIITLAIIVFAVSFFKSSLIAYQKQIEENNRILNQQKEELEQTSEQLKLANSSKDKLFSIISHDLRNPVNQLKSVFSLVESKDLNQEEFQQISTDLKTGIDNLHFLLDNLLYWSLRQQDGIKPAPQRFDLNELVIQRIRFYLEFALSKNILLSNQNKEALWVYADKDQIDLVLRNLISNAIKFTPKGGGVACNAFLKDEVIEFYVKDSGTGIQEYLLESIFSFENGLSSAGTKGEKGTGLGLKLCKEMLEMNGGKIWVESKINLGSVFYFNLPRATPLNK